MVWFGLQQRFGLVDNKGLVSLTTNVFNLVSVTTKVLFGLKQWFGLVSNNLLVRNWFMTMV